MRPLKRPFLYLLVALFAMLIFSSVSKATGKKQPNILFIITDQQTASAMSCANNPWLKTPSIDRLANHGVRFTRAYCSQPLCGPSRSAILTGMYPHQLNASINLPEKQGFWSRDIKILGTYMKEAGYETGYVGKWHLPIPAEDKEHHGFDYITNTKRRDWQDASIPADCGDFLKKEHENPFFLVASFINPHDICEWARGQKLRMDEINNAPEPEDCPPLPDNLEIPENEPVFLREMHLKSPRQYPTVGWEDQRWRQYKWAYYRLVEQVDKYIGRVLESLERHGHLENTVIIFTSDHGDGVGAHRLNQKQALYEEASNIPLIISHLTKGKKKTDTQTLVNIGMDLLPTFCDYAGLDKASVLKGRSLKLMVDGQAKTGRLIFLETEFAEGSKSFGISGRAVLDDRYKYIIYSEGHKRDQLFDLKNDPGEMNDLSENENYKAIKARFIQALKKWQKETNDNVKLF